MNFSKKIIFDTAKTVFLFWLSVGILSVLIYLLHNFFDWSDIFALNLTNVILTGLYFVIYFLMLSSFYEREKERKEIYLIYLGIGLFSVDCIILIFDHFSLKELFQNFIACYFMVGFVILYKKIKLKNKKV